MILAYENDQHQIWHGDILEADKIRYDAVWTDPPWNPGILAIFAKQAMSKTAKLPVLLETLASLIGQAPLGGWIEFSDSTPQYLEQALAEPIWGPCLQTDGSRARLYAVPPAELPAGHERLAAIDLMEACLRMLPPDAVILDPFLGTGMLIRAANRTGHRTVGIELSAKRCEQAAMCASKGLT